MIKTECFKCGAELTLYDSYGVCSKCGEIVGFDVEEPEEIEIAQPEEKIEEVAEEIIEEPTVEVVEEDITEEVVEETDVLPEEEVQEEESATENTQEPVIETEPETVETPEIKEIPKKSKAPIVIAIIALVCVLAGLVGAYYLKNYYDEEKAEPEETAPVNDIIEEIPDDDIELEEPEVIEEINKEEVEKIPEPVIVEEEPVKKEEAIIKQAPSISYRIRTEATDSQTQIGAFSDLERAKAFAQKHAADGYKVFDMDGNLVYEP